MRSVFKLGANIVISNRCLSKSRCNYVVTVLSWIRIGRTISPLVLNVELSSPFNSVNNHVFKKRNSLDKI